MADRLGDLTAAGVAIWLDDLSRARLATGSLAGLVGKPLEEIERLFITETLKLAAGNREEAARMLGIGERTLYRKIKEYGL